MQDRITNSPNTFAAIYCRISSDKSGKSAGVERQQSDCRALAERLGLTVQHVLIDNDISAYSGKPRPSYKQLLDLMKSGAVSTVLAFHQDRLQRSPVELEQYVDASEIHRVATHTVLAGHIDLSTPSGRFNARIIGAAARYEVEHMIERQRAAKLQAAKDGKYLGGQRPYGFEPRRVAVRESEAVIIREMASRFTEGCSYWSLAIDLNHRGILTQHGKDWSALKVRNILMRPINAGIVFHDGIEYEAESPAILSRDEWAALKTAMEYSRRKSPHPGRARKHVLKGFLYCGVCKEKLFHKSKQQRDGSYKTTAACGKRDNQTGRRHGCGGVSRMVEPIIELVRQAVLYRLETPELATALHKQQSSAVTLSELSKQQREVERTINEISDDYYVHNLLSREQFERSKGQADSRLERINQLIAREYTDGTNTAIDLSGDLQKAWEEGSLEWRRNLLALLIDKIYVAPRPKAEGYVYPKFMDKYRFDPELITIVWRV
ncbi:recombinase family protein [Rhodococcus erythropolis]|uniref:recombinase family protein n=1 Tax=Rhodococcus erythropolis TaxID=1833 RepID=UPI003013A893